MVNNELVIVMKPEARRSLQVYCLGVKDATLLRVITAIHVCHPLQEVRLYQRKHVLAKGSMSLQKEIPLGSVVL